MLKSIGNNLDLNKLTLIFKNIETEKEYLYFKSLYKNKATKGFLLVFSIIYFLTLVFDALFLEIDSLLILVPKKIVVVFGLVFYFKFNKISYKNNYKYVGAFMIAVFGSIAFQAILEPGTESVNIYMVGYSMIVYSVYFFVGLRFVSSVLINIVSQIIFYSILVYVYPDQASVLVYFLLLLSNVLFLYSAYHNEYSNRELFYYINELELEGEKQLKLYQVLKNNQDSDKESNIEYENLEKSKESNIEQEHAVNTVELQPEHKNILIVDDENDNILYFEQVALKLHFNLFKAKNGLEALNLYKKHKSKIALVLMDIRMPEMDGYQTANEIKEINKNVPVILISAFNDNEIVESKADLVLSKPITPKKLTEVILKYIK